MFRASAHNLLQRCAPFARAGFVVCALVLLLPGCGMLPTKAVPDPAPTQPANVAPDLVLPHAVPVPAPTGTDVTPEPLPIAFTLEVRAPKALRDLLTQHLPLQRFRNLEDLQRDELLRLLATADQDARELLATQGYFSPVLTLDLPAVPVGSPQLVVLTADPGPQTLVAQADIGFVRSGQAQGGLLPTDPTTEQAGLNRQQRRVQNNWGLPPGQAFTQSAWDRAKAEGLKLLKVRRHPTARIASSQADIDADQHQAKLQVTYETGPVFRFGPMRVEGSERYDPDAARRLARLPTGAVYDETDLLDAQQRLADSGYYDAVFLTLDTDTTTPEAAPVLAKVREASLQKLVFGAGLSTDSGPRLSLDHTHNRLPWLGWRAQSNVSLDRDTQSASTEWTGLPAEDGWRRFGSLLLQREVTGDYKVNSGRVRGGHNHTGKNIERNYFLQYDYANSQGLEAPPSSAALSLNVGWTGRYFNNVNAPTRGYGLALEAGVGTTLRPERTPFVRSLLRWQAFVPAGRVTAPDGASRNARLALRAQAGALLARKNADLPATQLFLTGGDTTVRGYSYRSIGARTDNDQLYGGRYTAVASAEWQRPIVYDGKLSDWESALFMDAGSVADRVGDLKAQVGVGAGVRWRSPVGPLQADLAYGVQAKQLRLHVRLGFSF